MQKQICKFDRNHIIHAARTVAGFPLTIWVEDYNAAIVVSCGSGDAGLKLAEELHDTSEIPCAVHRSENVSAIGSFSDATRDNLRTARYFVVFSAPVL